MRPPVAARTLVRLFADSADREFVLADLADRFREVARMRGPRAARWWYWSQAWSAVAWALVPDVGALRRKSWAGVLRDLRLGLRTLRRSPLHAVGVAGTLALGLAAATLVSAVAWKVWLAPMPYPDPDRVVRLYEIEPKEEARSGTEESLRHQFSPPLLEEMRARSWRTLDGVSAVLFGQMKLDLGRGIRSVSRFTLSPNGFAMLGIVPTLGRLPATIESEVLLSERFWRAELGADPDVVGSRLGVAGPLTVVGVAPLPAGFPGDVDVVNMLEWDEDADREDLRALRFIDVIARVKPDHTVAEAHAELNAFVAALGEAHPAERGWSVEAPILSDDLVGPFRDVLALLLAAGTAFLLLAGVNVVGLVAARRVEGRRDRSIRLALGASEGRLLRESLAEGLILAAVGSVAGILGATWLVGPVRALVPLDVPRIADLAVTPPLALGALGSGLLLGVLVGAAGYLMAWGAAPAVGRAPTWRAVDAVGRRALVVGQVAVTTLLVSAGIAILYRVSTLRTIDLGFDGEGVVFTALSGGTGPTGVAGWTASREILDELRARGMSAALAFNVPMSGEDQDLPPFPIQPASSSDQLFYQLHPVSSAYFDVMGIEVVAGRAFRPTDDASAEKVVIVSEDFVHRYYGSGTRPEDVVGRELQPVMLVRGPARVVGVVRSTRHHGPDAPVMPDLYIPFAQQETLRLADLLVRGRPDQVAEALSAVVPRVDSGLRWAPPKPYGLYLERWFAPLRLQLVTLGVLGALGVLLASLGLYAVMAWQVASRRREIGLRKAVGATDTHLLWSVVSGGSAMGAVGALLGLAAWYPLLPVSTKLVHGIDSAGGLVPLWVALVVGTACLLATLVPAARATKVDPVVTLEAD